MPSTVCSLVITTCNVDICCMLWYSYNIPTITKLVHLILDILVYGFFQYPRGVFILASVHYYMISNITIYQQQFLFDPESIPVPLCNALETKNPPYVTFPSTTLTRTAGVTWHSICSPPSRSILLRFQVSARHTRLTCANRISLLSTMILLNDAD